MIEKITIPQTSLPPKELLIEDRGQMLTFFDDALLVASSGRWDTAKDGDDMAIRDRFFYDNITLLPRIGSWPVEMYYYNLGKRYILEMGGVKVVFGSDEENPKLARVRCKELFDKIVKWKYGIAIEA